MTETQIKNTNKHKNKNKTKTKKEREREGKREEEQQNESGITKGNKMKRNGMESRRIKGNMMTNKTKQKLNLK